MPPDRAFVSSRLPTVLRDRLKAFAMARGQSVQQVVERAVSRLLEEEAQEPPNLSTALRKLRDAENRLRGEGVAAAWVFGSVARGEAGPGSDVDVAVDFSPDRRPTLLTLAHLQDLLETELGTRVDLGLRNDLRPHVARAFDRDAVRVF